MSINGHTRKIVISGVMAAVSIVLALTPLGFIPWFSGASLTIMHVTVIIAAILEGPVVGMVVGFLFGLFSLVRAAVAPPGPIDVFFVNPMISILPRIYIGLTTWLVFQAFRGKHLILATSISAFSGSLTNTFLVLGALGIAGALPWEVVSYIILANGFAEALACALVATAVIRIWKKVADNTGKSDLEDIDQDGYF